MRESNTAFDTYNAFDYKTPMYLIHFDGETTDYCNHKPGSSSNTLKKYLKEMSGLSHRIYPEEGKATIGSVKATILNFDDEITQLLATDSVYFHRRKTTIKAGYQGMDEADMLTIVGWVTNIEMTRDLGAYVFEISDPQSWLDRTIFRNATSDNPVILAGNLVNILLAILTSTGNGTNGTYDYLAASDGLAIDDDYINVSNIESVRDDWYPGDSHYFKFTITKPIKARDFIQREILKQLTSYPTVDGQGRFDIKPFKPPIASSISVQSFDEEVIVGLPRYDMNLPSLINEIDAYYDWSNSEADYQTNSFHIETTSVNSRGPGSDPWTFKSKGMHSNFSPASVAARAGEILEKRKTKVFGRWANPPVQIKHDCFFSRWLSEPGDIVPMSHPQLPDVEVGSKGIVARKMEVINRNIDWQKGRVTIELLDTGFAKGKYGAFSPRMIVTSGTDPITFVVSSEDGAKFEVGYEIAMHDGHMHQKTAARTISANSYGYITVDNSMQTPSSGWIGTFADYGSCTSEQQLYSFFYSADSGTMTEADLISP